MISRSFGFSIAGIGVLCGMSAVHAQSTDGGERALEDEIVVRGVPLRRTADELAAPVTILAGDELVYSARGTLGDTLEGRPGVRSDTFGAGASRPVVRGQTAPRVRVLTDGGELMDASVVSPDHAVVVEPLLLERIEVLRGPSALLYGGAAIGGAVNVIDSRTTTSLPEETVAGVAELRGGSADAERSGVAGVTIGAGRTAIRFEGAFREADDYRFPDGDLPRVPGSYVDDSMAGAGFSWIGERGSFGVAYSGLDKEYGLPGHSHEYEGCHPDDGVLHCEEHDHEHDHEAGDAPFVDLRNDRLDLRADYRPAIAALTGVRVRAGVTDYEHDESEGDIVGTTFRNDGYDLRVELEHAPLGNWYGVAGVQAARSDFSALGIESFLPESTTDTMAAFGLEEYRSQNWRVELALRQEWQDIETSEGPWAEHRSLSASGAFTWKATDALSVALTAAHSQRAPTAQELYADGVHLATNTYEIGDPTLEQETSRLVDVTLRRSTGAFDFAVSLYRNEVDDYIYAETLDQLDEFRLIRYAQHDAIFTGAELEASYTFTARIRASVYGDVVRGRLAEGAGNLPRIPAARVGARFAADWGRFVTNVDYYFTFEQEDLASFETFTPDYDMLNATVAYRFSGRFDGQVFLRATNLLDDLALNHASFIKNSAPLMGRNAVVGFRLDF